jgi:hypothetical protein
MLKTVSSIANAIGALNFKGTWDAATNTPTLASSVGVKGDYYYVSVAGNTDLNGITDWQVTDLAVFNGSVWQKIDNTDQVLSVNGQTGVVVLATMSNQNANNVAITGGVIEVANLVAANVSVTANLFANLATSNTAAMPDPSLPLNPEGYVNVVINGATKKVPYYGV